jgi:hypothetical protein
MIIEYRRMREACSTHGRNKRVVVRKMTGRDHLRDLRKIGG